MEINFLFMIDIFLPKGSYSQNFEIQNVGCRSLKGEGGRVSQPPQQVPHVSSFHITPFITGHCLAILEPTVK